MSSHRAVEASLDGRDISVAIVVARFNSYVTESMLTTALQRLAELGVRDESITIVRTPGSFELPLAAKKLAQRSDVDAVIALGAVIRGETAHFEHVAYAASEGLARVAEETEKPVVFGVLTTENTAQAMARVPHAAGYAEAAVEMANTYRALGVE